MMLSSIRKTIAKSRTGGRLTTYRDRYLIATLLSFLPLSLPTILKLFGSDKQQPGKHSYGAAYHQLLRPFKYKRAKILEIGLLAGDSLLAWRAFFPFAIVVGIDIEPKQHMSGSATRIYTVDQGSAPDLALLAKQEAEFDIVIDDGSHYNHHQIFSFRQLFPHLRDGGIYVIEDVQTSFWSGFYLGRKWDGCAINSAEFRKTCYGEFLELAKYLNQAEFETLDGIDPHLAQLGSQITRIAFEHNVITIWKGSNNLPSNVLARTKP